MKRSIHWITIGLVVLGLSAPMMGNTASIFVVSGQVTNGNSLPIDGLEVTVSNETKNLALTNRTGDSGQGIYAATFIDFFGGSVADAGDQIKVSVTQRGNVAAEESYTVVQGDFDASGQTGEVGINLRIPSKLSLTSVTPDNALAAGGETVQIMGYGFETGVTVTFGGIQASDVTLVSAEELTVTVPAGARGAVEIVVTDSDGNWAAIQFTYIDYPPWDLDKSGSVNIFDLVGVASQFGKSAPGIYGDVDNNGTVNIFDLVLVASHFGETTVASAPPLVALNSPNFAAAQHTGMSVVTPGTSLSRRVALTELENLSDTDPQIRIAANLLRQWLSTAGEIPNDAMLLPNYPNPFNPETWIPYHLADSADVTIHIYNLLGQPVRRLEIGHRHAGRYVGRSEAAYWDGLNDAGESVTSGVYFYSIVAGEFSATRKMVIGK